MFIKSWHRHRKLSITDKQSKEKYNCLYSGPIYNKIKNSPGYLKIEAKAAIESKEDEEF